MVQLCNLTLVYRLTQYIDGLLYVGHGGHQLICGNHLLIHTDLIRHPNKPALDSNPRSWAQTKGKDVLSKNPTWI